MQLYPTLFCGIAQIYAAINARPYVYDTHLTLYIFIHHNMVAFTSVEKKQ